MLIIEKWKLSLEDLKKEYPDEDLSEVKLQRQKWALIIILFAALPAHIIVYQGRLLSLPAFKWIKMNAQGLEGASYNRLLLPFNILFFMSKTYWLRYDEYILYIRKNKKYFAIRSVTATVLILSLIIGFQVSQKDEIKEFVLPKTFIVLMLMLQFQMEIGLFFKLMLFPVVFLSHRLLMAMGEKCCRNKCLTWRSVSEDLEIDVN